MRDTKGGRRACTYILQPSKTATSGHAPGVLGTAASSPPVHLLTIEVASDEKAKDSTTTSGK